MFFPMALLVTPPYHIANSQQHSATPATPLREVVILTPHVRPKAGQRIGKAVSAGGFSWPWGYNDRKSIGKYDEMVIIKTIL